MADSVTITRDLSQFEAHGSSKGGQERRAELPRLRVLYHVDLSRIGASSHPELALEDGEWATIGRKAPLFITAAPGDLWRPLEDPTVSRAQLRVRWLPSESCFEVVPAEGARREAWWIDPASPGERRPLLEASRLPVGAAVGVDERLLLGLERIARHPSPEEDRLGLIGESPASWRLRDEIRELAPLRQPVLILGETGSGKELVASALHAQGERSARPFRTLNCAALPEHLVESLLFGHERGAFTGASARQVGVFEAAHGGTLFLDELGEMPLGIQPKLLRVLQDGRIIPLGQHEGREADVRLIAATHRAPEREIEAGRLRADLYHRLATHLLRVPPLRARPFDVPELFVRFLDQARRDQPKLEWLWREAEGWRAALPLGFVLDLLRCPWPGNVRELRNVAERAARRNLAGKPFVRPELPEEAPRLEAPAPREEAQRSPASEPAPRSPERADRRLEAARLLGIAPKTVAKLLDEATLAGIDGAVHAEGGGDAAHASRLESALRRALHALLMEKDFAQASVARALGLAPWTLIRLMQRLDLKRPSDLTLEEIEGALEAAGGDAAMAAQQLEVSEHGLKKRLAALRGED